MKFLKVFNAKALKHKFNNWLKRKQARRTADNEKAKAEGYLR